MPKRSCDYDQGTDICPYNQIYQYFNQHALDMIRVQYMWTVPNKRTQFLTKVNQHYILKVKLEMMLMIDIIYFILNGEMIYSILCCRCT
jgi:hypothetical protein